MRYLLVAGFVFAAGCLDGLFARQEAEMVRYEQAKAMQKKAALYATVIAACANGGGFSLEDTEILCRRKR